MLTYLINTTEALISTVILLGLAFAYSKLFFEKAEKKVVLFGTILGFLASIIMSYMKNATNKIDTGRWNLIIFAISLVAFLVFMVFSIGKLQKKMAKAGAMVNAISLSVLIFTIILYAFPDVLAYPYGFLVTDYTIFSTAFLYKFIGFLFGLILVFLMGLATYQVSIRFEKGRVALILKVVLLINALRMASVGLQILLAKRMIKSNHTLFLIAKETSNNSGVFIYATMILGLIIPVLLTIKSLSAKEAYSNPAEHRKIRAKWRNARRWSSVAVLALVMSVLNLTVVKAIDSQEVELSPVEDAKVENGNVYVPFEAVEDGHLHRFAYVTDEGTQIRFIVIKKPNSSAYGIGLDACDICGETGYFEKDGQVVCKLCDVVMNISTIGFKGGCNPIVIPYSIENGQIVVPTEGLLEYESEFKK